MMWLAYGGVFAAFLATHSIPIRPTVRARLVAAFGHAGFGLGYSLLSTAMLLILIRAAAWPDPIYLWPTTLWAMEATKIGMALVCMWFAVALGHANPFSFGGSRRKSFDPERPGLVRLTRHPMLLGLASWAGLHLLPNGDLAHVLLFGALGGFALLGMRLIDRKRRREMGPEVWAGTLRRTKAAPPFAGLTLADLGRAALGLVAYMALLHLHEYFAGVALV
ncbi:NnrU family protein [Thioclava nitratireducens]|uniref:NnrU family protein n=1 Tax=Thioclava nitratireducens TaxID=1915078 RepID=UPI00248082FA|nr:NnrU family protein [Thioclava nitratireducens]WGT49747.1 NnrU family protein [Thioclava nitratireducens]